MPSDKRINGSLTAWVSVAVSVILVLLGALAYMGGRFQSPTERKEEVQRESKLIMMEQMEEPKKQIAKIETKVEIIEEDVKEIHDKQEQILGLVQEIHRNGGGR